MVLVSLAYFRLRAASYKKLGPWLEGKGHVASSLDRLTKLNSFLPSITILLIATIITYIQYL
jgi:hypothetical protein